MRWYSAEAALRLLRRLSSVPEVPGRGSAGRGFDVSLWFTAFSLVGVEGRDDRANILKEISGRAPW